jgi:hypothetical protein
MILRPVDTNIEVPSYFWYRAYVGCFPDVSGPLMSPSWRRSYYSVAPLDRSLKYEQRALSSHLALKGQSVRVPETLVIQRKCMKPLSVKTLLSHGARKRTAYIYNFAHFTVFTFLTEQLPSASCFLFHFYRSVPCFLSLVLIVHILVT